jgi:glucan phosphoethanolaminetransferase (alkaline phosphatase superfamily)
MFTQKSKTFNISRNFAVLCIILKLLGVFPLAAFNKNHKISGCRLILTLFIIALVGYCYGVYFSDKISETILTTKYAENLDRVLDNSAHFLSMLAICSVFVSLFLLKNQYSRLVAKFSYVDASFEKINCSVKRVSRKTLIVMSGLLVGFILLHIKVTWTATEMINHKTGEQLEFSFYFIRYAHFFHKMAAVLHFCMVLLEVKTRFDTLKNVLENLKL